MTIGAGASAPADSGDVRASFVGPNTAITLVPTAPARCIAPESFDTTAAACDNTPARVARSLFPQKSIKRLMRVPVFGRRREISSQADRSTFEPTITTLQPRWLMI